MNQFGFAVLNNDGKPQKFVESDFRTPEPVVKFMWGSSKKNTYIVCSGTSIRVGALSE